MKRDWLPLALIPALALVALPLVASLPIWVTLTVAGLAMGMMIFMMASGLTLVFGLMDVMNFAHGVFISVGAYAAASLVGWYGAGGRGSPWWSYALLVGAAVIRERERGTIEQLIVTPVQSLELLIGKLLPNAAVGVKYIYRNYGEVIEEVKAFLAAGGYWPPFFIGLVLIALPRPEPLFLPPP